MAAVLIIGGIWFWCHRKAEKEKEVSLVSASGRRARPMSRFTDLFRFLTLSIVLTLTCRLVKQEARQRAAARAARKNGTARPTLIKNKSAVSDAPSEKDTPGHYPQGRHQAPPVPVIPSQYLVSKHGHGQQQQQPYGQEGGYDRYAERDGEYYSSHASTEMNTHGTSPTSSTGSHASVTQPKPTVPPPAPISSTSTSSGSDRRSRAQQRIEAANAAKEREAVLAAANPIGRYAPARPSPLRAEERKDDDEAVPKWGSKPFRSANTSTSNTNNQETGENNSTAPISLAPPIDTSGRDKAVSGEWGVAYSDVDDGAGAFEHDDYDTRSDGRKSMGADLSASIPMTSSGRQPTGYAYDPSTSPRSRAVSGGAPDVYAQQHYHQQPQYQQQQYQAQDPYAQSRYAYQNDEDPYAPSPARRDVGRGGY